MQYLDYWNELATQLHCLIRSLAKSQFTECIDEHEVSVPYDAWCKLQLLVEVILVPTDEFVYLRNRIKNAEMYFYDGETGAAAFELKLLLRRIRRLQKLFA